MSFPPVFLLLTDLHHLVMEWYYEQAAISRIHSDAFCILKMPEQSPAENAKMVSEAYCSSEAARQAG